MNKLGLGVGENSMRKCTGKNVMNSKNNICVFVLCFLSVFVPRYLPKCRYSNVPTIYPACLIDRDLY